VNDPRVSYELLSHPADPGPSRTDTPLFAAVKQAILNQHPDAIVVPAIIPYGTDNQKFRQHGAIGYGLIPLLVDSATIATMHSDSEHIPVAEFRKALHIYFDILSAHW
jgi:acetylornithine deacetylase/succinyl-diaminopimelate desuccinylase-like protein